ncbi:MULTISPECIES: 2,5-didehydrogluconate reductase DkgB [Halomonas]|uniref:Diketogulonate reductase-like aldo/keto reductase n=1 Tax=Halomonas ventosae TaxID=229007 RepID=A0A4R6HYR9_9GAMM|nr:2,5-didehydrogluconate reductase DkgB [Halomonas ventosae]TDO13891.1 diketogulonate reductase-like aldo/keto reductase [Halomonas ventosae]
MSTLTLPNPGLGTFRLKGDTLKRTIHDALDLGYRHIDTAQMYDNEQDVGAAIAASDVPRESLFLTTKVWHDRLEPASLKASVRESLEKLGTDYVNLLLIHWPSPDDAVPMADYLKALHEVQQAGQARHIGVSNFTIAQVDRALEILGPDALLTNQVEVHPFLQNREVVEHCQARGLTVTGYMPLAVGKVLEDETLKGIAEAHGVTPAQVALAWIRSCGVVAIPSSTRREHLAANLEAFEIMLSDEELQAIAGLDRGERIADPDFAPDWD